MIRLKALFVSAAVAAAVCAMSAAAAAPADAKVRIADYAVTLEGVQKNTWSHDHPGSEALCDPSVTGSGFETYRFRSRKPTKVRAVLSGANVEFTNSADGFFDVQTNGSVTRQGQMTWGHVDENECPGGGGPADVLDKDCGTHAVADRLRVYYNPARRGQILLESGPDKPFNLFDNCDWNGKTWSNLITHSSNGRPIGQMLPGRDLFEYGKNIVIARGVVTGGNVGGSYRATIRWELSFRKLKEWKDPAQAGRGPRSKTPKQRGGALDQLLGMIPKTG